MGKKLVLLGPPGAGKGTVAALIATRLEIPHISTGDLFRAAVSAQNDLGRRVKSILDSGELVPDELTVAIVEDRLAEDDARNGFILDGFPRTTGQADALAEISPVDTVVNFEVSQAVIVDRLSGRRVCRDCGKIYNIKNLPPEAADCDLVQRDDDKPEAVRHRLEVYTTQTAPLIAYYRDRELLAAINAEATPEESAAQVVALTA